MKASFPFNESRPRGNKDDKISVFSVRRVHEVNAFKYIKEDLPFVCGPVSSVG